MHLRDDLQTYREKCHQEILQVTGRSASARAAEVATQQGLAAAKQSLQIVSQLLAQATHEVAESPVKQQYEQLLQRISDAEEESRADKMTLEERKQIWSQRVFEYNRIIGALSPEDLEFRKQKMKQQPQKNQQANQENVLLDSKDSKFLLENLQDQMQNIAQNYSILSNIKIALKSLSLSDQRALQIKKHREEILQNVENMAQIIEKQVEHVLDQETLIENRLQTVIELKIREFENQVLQERSKKLANQLAQSIVFNKLDLGIKTEFELFRKRKISINTQKVEENQHMNRLLAWEQVLDAVYIILKSKGNWPPLNQRFKKMLQNVANYRLVIKMRKAIQANQLELFLKEDILEGWSESGTSEKKTPKSNNKTLQNYDSIGRLQEFYQVFIRLCKEQQMRKILKQEKTNTMQRYFGDKGQINYFHMIINHKNLTPLLREIAPEVFRENAAQPLEDEEKVEVKSDLKKRKPHQRPVSYNGSNASSARRQSSTTASVYSTTRAHSVVREETSARKMDIQNIKNAEVQRKQSAQTQLQNFFEEDIPLNEDDQKFKLGREQMASLKGMLINRIKDSFDGNGALSKLIDKERIEGEKVETLKLFHQEQLEQASKKIFQNKTPAENNKIYQSLTTDMVPNERNRNFKRQRVSVHTKTQSSISAQTGGGALPYDSQERSPGVQSQSGSGSPEKGPRRGNILQQYWNTISTSPHKQRRTLTMLHRADLMRRIEVQQKLARKRLQLLKRQEDFHRPRVMHPGGSKIAVRQKPCDSDYTTLQQQMYNRVRDSSRRDSTARTRAVTPNLLQSSISNSIAIEENSLLHLKLPPTREELSSITIQHDYTDRKVAKMIHRLSL